jgi:hypothetical protein
MNPSFADLRRPAVQVAAEGHTRPVRQEVASILLSLDELDQDGDALVVVHQAFVVPVK